MSAMASLVHPGALWRHTAAGLAVLGLFCSLAAGCGGAQKRTGASLGSAAGSGSPAVAGSTTSSTASGGSGPPAGGGRAAPAVTTTTVVSRGSGNANSAAAAGSGTSSPSGNGAPAAAAPGTYTVDQSGSVTGPGFSSSEPPQGTLVVDPVQSNGVQVSHRYIDTKNPPANTDTQYRSNGPFILSATEAGPQGNTTCTFNPPIAAPPWPPAAGETFSSQGNCGSFTVSVQGRISGTQSVTLKDGETFTVWVIDSTLNISGQVTGSGTQVDWYSPAVRLPLHEQVDISGTYEAFNFKLHSVSDLVSSHPS